MQVKVFISSTFRDLNPERNYLVKVVFPKINKELDNRNQDIKVYHVDLRWGITNEDMKNKRVIDTCMKYLHEAKPYFVGIIGNRYGSVMSPNEVDITPIVSNYYPAIFEDIKNGASITEIEIMNGILRSKEKMNAIFFIKKNPQRYEEETTEQFNRLMKLRNRICSQSQYPVYYFDNDLSVFEKLEGFILQGIRNDYNTTKDSVVERIYSLNLKNKIKFRQEADYNMLTQNICERIFSVMKKGAPIAFIDSIQGGGRSTILSFFGDEFTKEKCFFIHLYGESTKELKTSQQVLDYIFYAARIYIRQEWDKKLGISKVINWFRIGLTDHNIDFEDQLIKEMERYHWFFICDNAEYDEQNDRNNLSYIASLIINIFNNINKSHKLSIDYHILFSSNAGIFHSNDSNIPSFRLISNEYFSAEKYLYSFLKKYSKNLDTKIIEELLESNIVFNPGAISLVCNFILTNITHEEIPTFINKTRKINSIKDLLKIYIDLLIKNIGEDSAKKMITSLLCYEQGVTFEDLLILIGNVREFSLKVALSDMKPLLYENENKYFIYGSQYKNILSSILNITIEDKKRIAERAKKIFYDKIIFEGSWEFFAKQSYEHFWLVFQNYISCVPGSEYIDMRKKCIKTGLEPSLEMRSLLNKYGGLSNENIDKAYHQWLYHYTSNGIKSSFKKSKNQKSQKDCQDTFSEYTGNIDSFKIYKPTDINACINYIQSLIICEDYKTLEKEITYSQILNALWDDRTYHFAWYLLLKRGYSLVQKDILNDRLCRKEFVIGLCRILGRYDDMKYYQRALASR